MIVDNYLSNIGPTNLMNFETIGDWDGNVLDRSSITELMQHGNGIATAAYYHAFQDEQGEALRGNGRHGYVLTFPKKQIPDADRFWSLTGYTPEAIELARNAAKKYLVASYTPGLTDNQNGSVSIYMARKPPAGTPFANWLPVPAGPFSVMIRVYGPEGSVAAGTYVPPGEKKQ